MNTTDANVDVDQSSDVLPVEKELYVPPKLIVLDARDTESNWYPGRGDFLSAYS
jgi:hypothetical protein